MLPVCVIGLGLIGGSVLRAAVAAGRTAWGATASAEDAEKAAADGFCVERSVAAALRRAEAEEALVVLAVPLPAMAETLHAVGKHAARCRLTDVASVKGPVAAAVRQHAPQARYAGGHPMAGTAESGWPAGAATLFQRSSWVVCIEPETEAGWWREAAVLALDCGAYVVPAGTAAHDAAVARVSHLPHLLAAVLAAAGAAGGPLALSLAAGSFGDATRVAGTRPELVRAMCEGNRDALLDAVDFALGQFGAARGSLASTGSLAVTVQAGHRARLALDEVRNAAREPVSVSLTEPGALTELRELGELGGRVVAVDGPNVAVEVPVSSEPDGGANAP